ncbi:MAG TPA: alpha/beta hydrolase [Burkholderiaceae bacterium]
MSTWVLLRGLARESGHWAGFEDVLRERLAAPRMIALDLPGNGALYRQCSHTRIEAMTAWCLGRLRELGAAPPYYVLAVSLGGMVAVDWASRAPESLAGGVLVNTSLRRFSPFHQRLRPASWPQLLSIALGPGSAADREASVLRLTSRRPQAAAAVLERWATLRRTQPVAPANALRQLLAAARYRAPAQAPRVPLLILSSRRDALVDPRCSQAIAAHWHCESAVNPAAGHDLTLDDGPWVAEQVARWLESM